MKRLNVRTFLRSFRTIDEPIEVVRYTDTIGFYYPTGTQPTNPVPGMFQVTKTVTKKTTK